MRRGLATVAVVVLAAAGAAGTALAAGGVGGTAPGEPSSPGAPPPATTDPGGAPPAEGGDPVVAPRAPDRPADPPTSPSTPPPSTAPPSSAPPVPAPIVLRPGARGVEVEAVQRRLAALGYWIGVDADGVYGPTTAQAVLAFQKVAGLQRDGLAGPVTRDALAAAERPAARSGPGTGRIVEIDLARQVLLVVDDGRVVEVFNTSTGTRATPTPPGRFTVQRHIDGIRRAPLGDLYRPKYFNGGIAVHGSPSIPGHPASHGCARVHDRAMDHLWDTGALQLGTPVWVY